MCKKFSNETMYEIISYLETNLKEKDSIQIEVLNPNLGLKLYSGEKFYLEKEYIYRSYKAWSDLAEILFCKLLIENIKNNSVILKFVKLNSVDSFHSKKDDNREKYGIESMFFRLNKIEEPSFLYTYKECLKSVHIENKKRVLNLGINKGDEFEVIENLLDEKRFNEIEFTGLDYSNSAIEYAKNRFKNDNLSFVCADINSIDTLNLKKFDLIISIGTLQSSNLNFKLLFMNLVQNYLEDRGSIILGFPNCRWIDGEIIYGAKAPNYNFSEQSILYKDVYFCKKYLQQKQYRVTLRGKNYLFLTATSIK